MKEIVTNDGKKGGWLKGKPHYDKDGKPLGGIKAVVTDAGGKPVELEGGEVIINKEASAKHWKELSRINQSAGNGVAIGPPSGDYDEDPEEYKEGGKVIEFNANHVPNKWILNYAKNIKEKHPEIWKLGGNIFGNQAFINLKRVSERGYWLDSEKWMYIKWRSYVARHKKDFRIEGVVAMLKWVDKVDKGWAYMKNLIEERIDKIEDKKESKGWKHKMKKGGKTIAQTPAPKKERIYGSKVNKPQSAASESKAKSIKLDEATIEAIKNKIKGTGISLATAKAVVRRGMGAYSSSHRPTISGGKPNSRVAWGLARLNAFLYKAEHGKSKSGKYIQDDDLLRESGYKVSKMGNGGNVDISEWQTEEPELFKCLLTVRSLVEANATVTDSFVDTHNNLYVIEYEDSNPYFDGIITETCKTLTECEDYLEVEEVEVTDKFVLVPLVINSDIRFRDGGEITTVNKNNYFQATKCDFKPVNFKDCIEILDQYKSWRRKKNKPKFIVSSKFGNLMVDYESERKNSFWQSRSLSYYFISEHNKFIIRISDHWSKSNYDRSKKLNCGFIRSCYWTNFGEKFTYDIPGQSYSSELIGGAANFSDFTIIDKDSLFAEGGEIEKLIEQGVVELKMFDTNPEHAKEYGLHSVNPLYIQNISVAENERLKGIGKKVLAYIDEYAIKNGHDVVFGHITQKADFTKDYSKSSFSNIDLIKNWLHSNGYEVRGENNDFYKMIKNSPNRMYAGGGELAKGIKTEQEHRKTLEKIASGKLSVDQAIKRTAKDHLKEDPKYYTKLLEMESKMAKGGEITIGGETIKVGDEVFLRTKGQGTRKVLITNISDKRVTLQEGAKAKENPPLDRFIRGFVRKSVESATEPQVQPQIQQKVMPSSVSVLPIREGDYFTLEGTPFTWAKVIAIGEKSMQVTTGDDKTFVYRLDNVKEWIDKGELKVIPDPTKIVQPEQAVEATEKAEDFDYTSLFDTEKFVPSTERKTWNAVYNVGDKVRIRVDMSMNVNIPYDSPGNEFTIQRIDKSGAIPFKLDKSGNNIGGLQRPENPTGVLYILDKKGGSWEGKDLELISKGTGVSKPSSKPSAQAKVKLEKPKPVENALARLDEWEKVNMTDVLPFDEEMRVKKALADLALSLSVPTKSEARSDSQVIFDMLNKK